MILIMNVAIFLNVAYLIKMVVNYKVKTQRLFLKMLYNPL